MQPSPGWPCASSLPAPHHRNGRHPRWRHCAPHQCWHAGIHLLSTEPCSAVCRCCSGHPRWLNLARCCSWSDQNAQTHGPCEAQHPAQPWLGHGVRAVCVLDFVPTACLLSAALPLYAAVADCDICWQNAAAWATGYHTLWYTIFACMVVRCSAGRCLRLSLQLAGGCSMPAISMLSLLHIFIESTSTSAGHCLRLSLQAASGCSMPAISTLSLCQGTGTPGAGTSPSLKALHNNRARLLRAFDLHAG